MYILLTLLAETLVGLGLYKSHRLQRRRLVLILGADAPVRTPGVDRMAEWMAGDLSQMEERVATRIIKSLRKFVNTRAYEHLVRALVNRDSRLHQQANKLRRKIS